MVPPVPEPPLALAPPLASEPPFAPTPVPPEATVPAVAPDPSRPPGRSLGREEQASAAAAAANSRPHLIFAPTISAPEKRQRVELDKLTLKHECEEPGLTRSENRWLRSTRAPPFQQPEWKTSLTACEIAIRRRRPATRRARSSHASRDTAARSDARRANSSRPGIRIVDGFGRIWLLQQCEDLHPDAFQSRSTQPRPAWPCRGSGRCSNPGGLCC